MIRIKSVHDMVRELHQISANLLCEPYPCTPWAAHPHAESQMSAVK